MISINIFWFLWLLLTNQLEANIDYEIGLFGVYPFRLIRTNSSVREVLLNQSHQLGYHYQSFNNIVEHTNSIATEYTCNANWKIKHQLLAKHVARIGLPLLLQRYQTDFHFDLINTLCLDYSIGNYVNRVWFDACFGPTQVTKAIDVSILVSNYLSANFHSKHYWKIPILGPLLASLVAKLHQSELAIIKQQIQELMDGNVGNVGNVGNDGWLRQMKLDKTNKAPGDGLAPVESDFDFHSFVEESAFLVFLVRDFLYETTLEYVHGRIKLMDGSPSNHSPPPDEEKDRNDIIVTSTELKTSTTRIDNSQQINQAVHNSFFYPFRMRRTGPLQWSILDLTQSGIYWSCGPRACIGSVFSRHFIEGVENAIKPLVLSKSTATISRIQGHRRICSTSPVMLSNVSYDFPGLPFQQSKSKTMKLYHVNSVFWNPTLIRYVVLKMVNFISKATNDLVSLQSCQPLGASSLRTSCQPLGASSLQRHHVPNLKSVVIVSPEARGWCVASLVATELRAKLILVRKLGREKGVDVYTTKYDTVYSHDSLEIAQTSPLDPSSTVVILDDGVASGGSIQAVADLVSQHFKCKITMACAIFRHYSSSSSSSSSSTFNCTFPVFTIFDLFQ